MKIPNAIEESALFDRDKKLDEAAKDWVYNKPESNYHAFVAGANWQSKNTPIYILDVENTSVKIEDSVVIVEKNDKSKVNYTEEEVYDILFKHTEYFFGIEKRMSLTEWFEIHKKK